MIFVVLLLINWRGRWVGGLLIVSCVLSTLWFASISYNSGFGSIPLVWIKVLETLRDTSWLTFLYVILKQRPNSILSPRFKLVVPLAIFSLTVVILSATLFTTQIGMVSVAGLNSIDLAYTGYLLMALLGLLLVEQIYKNTLPSARWAMKYLCLGIGGIFAYDFFLYSEALLYNRINPDIWYVRGAINGICVPLIAVAVARNPQWKMDLFVSRHIVYQSTATTVAGGYLILMAIGGYYIRNFGGSLGSALQIVFFFSALMILLILVLSEQLRSRLKVYLAEHFYRNKYDYRQEWLNITKTLSENVDDSKIYKDIIKAIASIVNCPGGALWLADSSNTFSKQELLSFHEKIENQLTFSSEQIETIINDQLVVNIDQYKVDLKADKFKVLPAELLTSNEVWLFVPLINKNSLLGFILLTYPHTDKSFDAEDIDLLRTVGYQIASYIALLKVTERLTEARQFEVFNRLSAFVVHDIKNLVAQLSLINTNAIKFRNEPEFIEDVFGTIENSVAKMKRLLTNLRKGEILGERPNQQVNVQELVNEVIKVRSVQKPIPVTGEIDPTLAFNIEKDRFISVLEHLTQNAQEATSEDGKVEIEVIASDNDVKFKVSDTGSGMDSNFVRNRLFKPFDTTKGNAGMGIGVYESRAIINAMGGYIQVESKVNEGTEFTIHLPIIRAEPNISE